MNDKDTVLSLEQTLRLALEALTDALNKPMWNRVQMESAITAIKAALLSRSDGEAKGEPVAIFKADLDGGYVDLLAFQGQPLLDNTLLYTTPPQRKPLTDEEIFEALGGIDCTRPTLIARAIEAAHGIKGEA